MGDEGVLVIEECDICGYRRTTRHFGLDFTQDGRSDVVLSDQSAAMPSPEAQPFGCSSEGGGDGPIER